MTTTQQLLEYWRTNHQQIVETFAQDIQINGGPSFRQVEHAGLLSNVDRSMQTWQQYLEDGKLTPLTDLTYNIGQTRAHEQLDITETMYVLEAQRSLLLDMLDRFVSDTTEHDALARRIENGLHAQHKALIGAYTGVMREAQQMLAEREQTLAYQGQLIQELSTPIVPIFEGVLVLPLTGAVDSRRATQIMEAALEQIVISRADVLILDITGVPVVDTGVANYIIQMARAVNLLGAQVVLVGIGAEIAQTIVQLGVELRNIITRSNLQAGIEYALRQRGYAIRQA